MGPSAQLLPEYWALILVMPLSSATLSFQGFFFPPSFYIYNFQIVHISIVICFIQKGLYKDRVGQTQ
jgi:hypothetical protein